MRILFVPVSYHPERAIHNVGDLQGDIRSIQLHGRAHAHVVWRTTDLRRLTEAKHGGLDPYP
jgi:hypothetical protein